jgi:hypothetical protein
MRKMFTYNSSELKALQEELKEELKSYLELPGVVRFRKY